jgi:flagella basal body P-ring formation protein FlgA
VKAENLRVDLQKGTFTARLIAPATGKPLAHREISGRLSLLTDVPVLSGGLRAGDMISADDLSYVEMRNSDISSSTIVSAEKLIGQMPRRAIAAMRPVTAADIEAPALVKRGELVTVALQNGALNLTLQGKALQNGSEGDIVRIVNTASNRMLEGVVTGPQTVTIKSPDAAL